MSRLLLPLAVIAAVAPAHADGPFFWMDDMHLRSKAGVAFALGNPPSAGGDTLVLTTDVAGTFNVTGNLNLSVRVPIALAFFDDPPGDDSAAAVGNIGVGLSAIQVRRSRGSTIRLGLGGAAYLPTRSDGGDSTIAASAAGVLHLPDPGRWADATTLRGRGDFAISVGRLLFQAEANLDLLFRDGDDDIDLNLGLGPAVRLTPSVSALAELSITNITDDEVLVVDLGIRYVTRTLLLGVRLYLPTEEIAGEDVFGAGLDLAALF